MRSIITHNEQTIWDVAEQHMGSVEAVFDILELNPNIRPDEIIPTDTLVYVPDIPINQHVVDYYHFNKITPVTTQEDE